MKKVLVGICNIGNGHLNRQLNIVDLLISKNCNVCIAISKEKWDIIKTKFPNIKLIDIKIPWIFCEELGINFENTKNKYEETNIDQYKCFLNFAIEVESYFNGKPDLIISDYEPNVAQLSYAMNIPLLCMEQQSKFFDIPITKIDDVSSYEEIYRLNYFFPNVHKRYISSFFPVKSKNNKNSYILPIINMNENFNVIVNEFKIIVYFSPYAFDEFHFKRILDLLSNDYFYKYDIHIYTEYNFIEYKEIRHFNFFKISNNFKEDCKDALFVISTSGHQLISELILKEVPCLLTPFHTFEQNYNMMMVKKYKLGNSFSNYDLCEITDFIKKIDYYKKHIKKYKIKYWTSDWKTQLEKLFRKDFNLW